MGAEQSKAAGTSGRAASTSGRGAAPLASARSTHSTADPMEVLLRDVGAAMGLPTAGGAMATPRPPTEAQLTRANLAAMEMLRRAREDFRATNEDPLLRAPTESMHGDGDTDMDSGSDDTRATYELGQAEPVRGHRMMTGFTVTASVAERAEWARQHMGRPAPEGGVGPVPSDFTGLRVHRYPGLVTYAGKWRGGLRSGWGVQEGPFGRYAGQWFGDKMEGVGKYWYYQKSGKPNWYEGQFFDNKREGRGMFCWEALGEIYHGEWKKDMPHGIGAHTFPDGTMYCGEWDMGKMEGLGRWTFCDGTEYEGQFKDGKQNGYGRLQTPQGAISRGLWRDGRLIEDIELFRFTLKEDAFLDKQAIAAARAERTKVKKLRQKRRLERLEKRLNAADRAYERDKLMAQKAKASMLRLERQQRIKGRGSKTRDRLLFEVTTERLRKERAERNKVREAARAAAIHAARQAVSAAQSDKGGEGGEDYAKAVSALLELEKQQEKQRKMQEEDDRKKAASMSPRSPRTPRTPRSVTSASEGDEGEREMRRTFSNASARGGGEDDLPLSPTMAKVEIGELVELTKSEEEEIIDEIEEQFNIRPGTEKWELKEIAFKNDTHDETADARIRQTQAFIWAATGGDIKGNEAKVMVTTLRVYRSRVQLSVKCAEYKALLAREGKTTDLIENVTLSPAELQVVWDILGPGVLCKARHPTKKSLMCFPWCFPLAFPAVCLTMGRVEARLHDDVPFGCMRGQGFGFCGYLNCIAIGPFAMMIPPLLCVLVMVQRIKVKRKYGLGRGDFCPLLLCPWCQVYKHMVYGEVVDNWERAARRAIADDRRAQLKAYKEQAKRLADIAVEAPGTQVMGRFLEIPSDVESGADEEQEFQRLEELMRLVDQIQSGEGLDQELLEAHASKVRDMNKSQRSFSHLTLEELQAHKQDDEIRYRRHTKPARNRRARRQWERRKERSGQGSEGSGSASDDDDGEYGYTFE